MSSEMKPWQKGYPLEDLLEIENFYSRYNQYSLSPFSEVKKHRIADALSKDTHKVFKDENRQVYARMDLKLVKSRSPINMYRDVIIGYKEKGDKVITNLAWKDGCQEKLVEDLTKIDGDVWLFVWNEDIVARGIAIASGFRRIGTKITSHAEMYAVFFKDKEETNSLWPMTSRNHPEISPLEICGLKKTIIPKKDLLPLVYALRDQLSTIENDLEWTDHYSNYNKKHAWNALSLRGYSPDIGFITKPEEMSAKWKDEHKNVEFRLQDTELRDILYRVEPLLSYFPGIIHRVRLMGLAPGGGELMRHTDQVDPDAGVTDGKLMRFHFPLYTNDKVKFSTWRLNDGLQKTIHMGYGECWYIDVRKPHRAVNNGNSNRIHLVVDVEANFNVRGLLGDEHY